MLKGSILQRLEAAHKHTTRPLNLGVYYKNTLVALCHALEDYILDSESEPIAIVAFQRGKWYLQEADRYYEIAKKAQEIVIMATADSGFAEHPTSQKDNVTLVNLTADDPVAQEWHLMILSTTYTAMVLCQELSETDYGSHGQPESDLERKFYGFWTFEPKLVQETVELAISHIGKYDQELQEKLTKQVAGMTAEFGTHQRDDLGKIVSRVVEYLQTSQENLAEPFSVPFSAELDNNLLSNETQAYLRMAQLIDQADAINPMAAAEVAGLAEAMGQILDLPAWQIKRLRLAGFLHRLAPSLVKEVTEEESQAPCCRLVPSVEALRIMPRMRAIAHIITHQGEHWDGSGTPLGLDYDRIPLEARILGLVTEFQHLATLYKQDENQENPVAQALTECQQQASKTFDPKLVDALSLLVMGIQQGMSIEASQPKIAAGMWLLEQEVGEGAKTLFEEVS
ncbi:MAG: DICT sensory domain-containing protein [Oscillatoria sp. PMC 1068.18]|nr:DICT sensory domain-containing protein [Oscillatoria sp. PMC 1076.18]MEC4991127.1 DICT sensory domain-containing protein [Oscillatoria sp. PMC 1068.18]